MKERSEEQNKLNALLSKSGSVNAIIGECCSYKLTNKEKGYAAHHMFTQLQTINSPQLTPQKKWLYVERFDIFLKFTVAQQFCNFICRGKLRFGVVTGCITPSTLIDVCHAQLGISIISGPCGIFFQSFNLQILKKISNCHCLRTSLKIDNGLALLVNEMVTALYGSLADQLLNNF